MGWIKESFVDILVTIIIIAFVLLEDPWMRWIITGYTAILLLAKAIVLLGDNFLQLIKKTRTDAPEWFNHLMYGINTTVLLSFQWWYTGAGWALIWLLSYLAQRKLKARGAS